MHCDCCTVRHTHTHTHRNYCTYDTALLARLVFDIFDPDRLRVLAMPDYDAMLRMLYNTDTADPAVLTLLAINGSSDESTVTYTEFVQLAETHPQILQVISVRAMLHVNEWFVRESTKCSKLQHLLNSACLERKYKLICIHV
jgi:hypothetical protein